VQDRVNGSTRLGAELHTLSHSTRRDSRHPLAVLACNRWPWSIENLAGAYPRAKPSGLSMSWCHRSARSTNLACNTRLHICQPTSQRTILASEFLAWAYRHHRNRTPNIQIVCLDVSQWRYTPLSSTGGPGGRHLGVRKKPPGNADKQV
jgi:hypothetical protein